MRDGLQKGSSIKSSPPKFSLNLVIPRVNFAILHPVHTVNPLLSPPGGLFISNTFEGGIIETGGLFILAKTMVSVVLKEL